MKNIKGFSLVEISVVLLILGILFFGISNGIDIYYDVKYSTAQNLTNKSVINRINGLTIWLDASNPNNLKCFGSSNICNNDGKIRSWSDINPYSTDKINIGRNVNDNSTPTYISNGINGLPAIFFNQLYDQYLSNKEVSNPQKPPITKNNPEYTMIAVWKPIVRDSYSNSEWLMQIVSQGSSNAMVPSQNNLGGGLAYWPDNNIGFWAYWSFFNAQVNLNKNVNATIMILNDLNISIYHNSLNPVNGLVSNKTYVGDCEFTIGIWACRKPSAMTSYHGLISEIIVFDRAILDSEAKNIMKYLSQKWSIKLP